MSRATAAEGQATDAAAADVCGSGGCVPRRPMSSRVGGKPRASSPPVATAVKVEVVAADVAIAAAPTAKAWDVKAAALTSAARPHFSILNRF